jgi:DUF4097 and DUF4098 domain-containing protein YvlB
MKKYLLVLATVFGAVIVAHSQQIIDRSIDVDGQKVKMELSFGDIISIEAWNNNTIEIQVTVDIDDNKYNDYYSLDISESNGEISIDEKVDFEGIKKKTGSKNLCNFNTKINYTLKVPENLEFDLKSISGEIELLGCQGAMGINTVSGYIDYSIPEAHKANIELSTVTGDVYSNVKFDKKLPEKISLVGTNHELMLNGGNVDVELKTVSGDIYLRKK